MNEPGKGKPRCPDCGYRVRGKNHKDGDHHKKGRKSSN